MKCRNSHCCDTLTFSLVIHPFIVSLLAAFHSLTHSQLLASALLPSFLTHPPFPHIEGLGVGGVDGEDLVRRYAPEVVLANDEDLNGGEQRRPLAEVDPCMASRQHDG
eukprot:GHVU01129086.1.p4 GENE.GHVU01129086.1~~GHVU01129086.1.p4  ORF type:complete len:108 (+),score=4.90 GHVU01129086.1:1302-1625(+)